MRHLAQNIQRPTRHAFTLVELMIVIVIIGTLAGFILPAVMSSLQTARIAEVRNEITQLEGAIASFKATYGVEPPSRIFLYESGTGDPSWASHSGVTTINGVTLNNNSERARSIAFINRIWPNFNYNIPHDFNGDNSPGGVLKLTGAECLVLFLGGGHATDLATKTFAMIGFSKNPLDPFAAPGLNESREGPFFEFKASRLKLSPNTTNPNTLVYVDPSAGQTMPYVYASSYDGRGYQIADLFVNSSDDLNDVYRAIAVVPFTPHKPKGCQIISPGADSAYGLGGLYNTSAANNGLSVAQDRDNITNFSSRRLSE